MYGRTNSGKTAQIGELAEYVKKTTGKNSRLYTADRGGLGPIQPYIDLGILEVYELGDQNPWHFLSHATSGDVKDSSGKWIKGDNSNIGMFAFETLRAFAENLMESMKNEAAKGTNIGGGSNVSFKIAEGGEILNISGNNMAHFGVAQSRMTEEVWKSQRLPADYIVWTSSVSKDDDTTASGKILGPDVIGKALTAEVPRWFNYTFRLDVIPAQLGSKEKHVLYLGNHIDIGAGGAAGLGNIRMPLDGTPPEKNVIDPASIVTALKLIEGGQVSAIEAIRKRLDLPTS
jgi:hypothetical protein